MTFVSNTFICSSRIYQARLALCTGFQIPWKPRSCASIREANQGMQEQAHIIPIHLPATQLLMQTLLAVPMRMSPSPLIATQLMLAMHSPRLLHSLQFLLATLRSAEI